MFGALRFTFAPRFGSPDGGAKYRFNVPGVALVLAEGAGLAASVSQSLMEHQKHYHPGDGNVEPDWKGETSDALVRSEPARERQEECHQNQRKGEDGKQDV